MKKVISLIREKKEFSLCVDGATIDVTFADSKEFNSDTVCAKSQYRNKDHRDAKTDRCEITFSTDCIDEMTDRGVLKTFAHEVAHIAFDSKFGGLMIDDSRYIRTLQEMVAVSAESAAEAIFRIEQDDYRRALDTMRIYEDKVKPNLPCLLYTSPSPRDS